jgi:hypothetical protein
MTSSSPLGVSTSARWRGSVARFQQHAAERFLGLHIRTIGDLDLAVLHPQRDCVTCGISLANANGQVEAERKKYDARGASLAKLDPASRLSSETSIKDVLDAYVLVLRSLEVQNDTVDMLIQRERRRQAAEN